MSTEHRKGSGRLLGPTEPTASDPGDSTRVTLAARRAYVVPWWLPVAGMTLFLLAYTSPWMKMHYRALYGFKAWVLALDGEMNFGVWWSAVLLLAGAALLYEIWASESGGWRRAYLQLALVLAALAIDEIASLHEWLSGIGGWRSLAPFAVVILLALGDSLRRLWRDRESRTFFWLLSAGFLVLGTVPIQEYIEHNLTTPSFGNLYGRYIEEATELAGSSLLLLAAVYRRQGNRWGGGVGAVVPDPLRLPHMVPLAVAGFLVHLVAAQAPLVGIGRWDGSPAAVYPFAAFLALACHAYWMPYYRPASVARFPEVRGFWAAVGLLFLFCSIGNVQNLWGLVDGVPGLNRKWFQQMVALYTALIPTAWFIGLSLWRRGGGRMLWLLALPLTLVILYNLHHPSRKELAAGLFAFICTLAFLRPPSDDSRQEAPAPAPAEGRERVASRAPGPSGSEVGRR